MRGAREGASRISGLATIGTRTVAYREIYGEGLPPEGPRWVHIGRGYVYVDGSGRLAEEPAPNTETTRAEAVAAALLGRSERDPVDALESLEGTVERGETATKSVEALVTLAQDLARGPDPETLAKYAEPLAGRVARDFRKGRFRDVVRLVRATLAIYLLTERWRELVALLELDHLSAEELGDATEAASALRDLGVLAEAAGALPLAGELLDQARDLFEQVGDHAAAESTRQMAAQATQVATHAGIAVVVKVGAVAAAGLVLAGAATGFVVGDGVWFGLGDEKAREGGDAEILAFAAGDSDDIPGAYSPQSGFTPPEAAVEPGETLGACEPVYVYDYITFKNLATETPFVTRMSRGDEFSASNSGIWAGPADYVEGQQAYRSGAASGQPVPYGEWELVVEVGGVEVDRASVTLEESC